MVPPESPVRGPADLAGVPVGVGYHSGSHFATVQALEAVLAPEQATLAFSCGADSWGHVWAGRACRWTWGCPPISRRRSGGW